MGAKHPHIYLKFGELCKCGLKVERTWKDKEQAMKQVGLWIDRSKAVIVTIEEDAEIMREIKSNIKIAGAECEPCSSPRRQKNDRIERS